MERQTAIIVTVVSAVMCGCPGLFSCFFGTVMAAVSFVPDAEIDVFGSSDPLAALAFGAGVIVVGAVMIAIPMALWFFTVRGNDT